jgi:glycosyltransferase involved in cell wall biosynthesis
MNETMDRVPSNPTNPKTMGRERLRISLITPSFNQARFIRRTIDSVLAQPSVSGTSKFELDYRVIDGGSNDGTVEILKSYGPRLLWTSEKDDGQIDAINKGLQTCKGDVVGWINSDDVLLPGALERVATAFAAHPTTEWVHGRCRIIDENDRVVRRWVELYKHRRGQRHSFQNLLTENYISQMTAFWRRSVHAEIGYLDPSLDLAFDYDLFLRLAHRGPPVYIEAPLACFRWYETSKSGAGFDEQLRQATQIASRYGEMTPWTRARTQAKKAAIGGIYRLMGLARRRLKRSA